MSITDELRRYISGPAKSGISRICENAIANIADRIDAEHESACAEAYGNGVQSVALPDMTAYVKLPVDVDGVPIRVGDEMEGVNKYDTLKEIRGKVITVSFESNGVIDVAIRVWDSDGKSWHRAYLDPDASIYRHHRAPTVEDVLREFLGECEHASTLGYTDMPQDIFNTYAAKLRLAGDAE